MDRPLVIAFGVSLACHTVVLGLQLTHPLRATVARNRQTLEVIYEYQIAQQELRRLQQQLHELTSRSSNLPGIAAPQPQIRIPAKPVVNLSALLPGTDPGQATVVDLTNLVEASRGDPVLLSYFSAIREQIQQTANRHTWSTSEVTEGLVYISFLLTSRGQIHEATVLSERSVSSRLLQEIALKIINASSPFPPFPPSLSDPSKTVVVPLEFLLGS